MKLHIYAIRDSKGDMYNSPQFAVTHGDAERNFRMIANDKRSKINMFPEDYDLYHIGSFDDVSGKIEGLKSPEHVIKAANCLDERISNSVANIAPQLN